MAFGRNMLYRWVNDALERGFRSMNPFEGSVYP